jgi:hypothetical protein
MNEGQQSPKTEPSGMSPDEAFAILGDETRLNIVRVLWQTGALHEYDDIDDSASTLSFSELRKRVNVSDNGRFNYHLSKLVPHFVRKTDGGYRHIGHGADSECPSGDRSSYYGLGGPKTYVRR